MQAQILLGKNQNLIGQLEPFRIPTDQLLKIQNANNSLVWLNENKILTDNEFERTLNRLAKRVKEMATYYYVAPPKNEWDRAINDDIYD